MTFPVTGKQSCFGGPDDHGVGLTEGLALIELEDLVHWWFRHLFLRVLPIGMGVARSLNPDAFYCAMRWDYTQYPREVLRRSYLKVSSKTATIFCRPVDFGPGDGTIIDGQSTPDTGRILDLSPGGQEALGLQTDDIVTCDGLILPVSSFPTGGPS